jgi:hypothetical protein
VAIKGSVTIKYDGYLVLASALSDLYIRVKLKGEFQRQQEVSCGTGTLFFPCLPKG